jgi:hypothetical protein
MNGLALAAALALAQAPGATTPEGEVPAEAPAPKTAPSPPEEAGGGGAKPALPPRKKPAPSPSAVHSGGGEAAAARPFGPEEASRVARAFLDALARADANGLAAAAGEKFSFDGEVQSGREAIRRRWRALLSDRPSSPPPRLGDLQVLTVAEAVQRHGSPPPRLAPLLRPGVLVAIADVGGRTVVLFVAREGGRTAVLGMQG